VGQRTRTVVAVAGTLIVTAALASMVLRGRSLEVIYARWLLHNAPSGLMGLWVGWLLLRRQPGHGLGRVLYALGCAASLHATAISLADARFVAAGLGDGAILTFVPAEVPLDAMVPLWLTSWLWVPAAVAFFTLTVALFPDGRYPGPGWRWIGPVALTGATLVGTAYAIVAWPSATMPMTLNEQPLDTTLTRTLVLVGGPLVVLAVAGTIGSLVVRWRMATGEQRQQLRAVVIAGGAMALLMTGLWPWQVLWIPISLVAMWAFLGTYAIAIARYRLHDLDIALNRAVVATVLAALVTLAYLVIVIGVGSLVDRGSERQLLPLAAVGVVAVLFEPARRRVRRLVDRLLYGRDGDAYAVLSDLAGRLQEAGTDADLLSQVIELIALSTAARRAELVVTAAGGEQLIAQFGEPASDEPVLTSPVVHHGESMGELRLHARTAADLAPDAARLLEDMAGTFGILIANLHLRTALQRQVDELRRSRQRLVKVQDEARRALERDLHDGAQARLVALRLRLGLAAELVGEGRGGAAPEKAEFDVRRELDALTQDVDAALHDLRCLSHGIHPPALEGAGLPEALRAAVRGLPVDVRIDGAPTARYEPAIESAVYYACLEAVQNAVKHGARSEVHVVLRNGDGRLAFEVSDDGPGWDPRRVSRGAGLANLEDRVAALDGDVEVIAAPGRGTVVRGKIPLQGQSEPAAR
jgi:two-component system, NarL family, sensor kinase